MISREDLLRRKKFSDGLLHFKEKVMKKKNSEIESRLFQKTQYYVIAVGKKPIVTENDITKVRAYIYYNGDICFYSTQGRAYNKQDYIEYIDFVKQGIDKERYEWTNFWINKGQVIARDKKDNIFVDTEIVKPFPVRSKLLNKLSDLSMSIYYDYLRSINQENETKLIQLQDSFEKGVLRDRIERAIKSTKKRELDATDGEIIVRTKIEGYNFIMHTVKSLLNSNIPNRQEQINIFFNRVFYLELQGHIGDDEE